MDVQLFFRTEMPRPELHAVADGQAAVFSRTAPGKESPNEDAAALLTVNQHTAILVVADGVGGQAAGELASDLAVRRMIDAIRSGPTDGPSLRGSILNGIEQANRAIAELGVGAGTTLAVAEVQGRTVRPYHAGDSLIMVVGQRGRLKLQTVSHSPVGYAVEAGVLDEEEAMHHEDRHVISNMLGTADMRIEIGSTVELAPFDTLLLATDGLLDNLHNAEIIEQVRRGPVERVARRLVEQCHTRMVDPQPGLPCKPDDLTFIVFRGARSDPKN